MCPNDAITQPDSSKNSHASAKRRQRSSIGWLATDRRWLPKRHLAAKNPGCRGPNSLPPSTPRIGRALAQRQLENYPDAIASGRKNRERENLNQGLNSILAQTDFLPGMSPFPIRQIGRRAERAVH